MISETELRKRENRRQQTGMREAKKMETTEEYLARGGTIKTVHPPNSLARQNNFSPWIKEVKIIPYEVNGKIYKLKVRRGDSLETLLWEQHDIDIDDPTTYK